MLFEADKCILFLKQLGKLQSITSESKEMLNCETNLLDSLSRLKNYSAYDQVLRIKEISDFIDTTDKAALQSICTKEKLNEIDKMIEEMKMPMDNALLLLKKVGYCKVLKDMTIFGFSESSLSERFEKMIIEEDKKKEGKSEELLIDLCECYLSLSRSDTTFPKELLSICVSCLLKAALSKQEIEETHLKVEMALLAISNINIYHKIQKELYLESIVEIIKYHQQHNNLTHLAYQSAWSFLIGRFTRSQELKPLIISELHFVREETKELEKLERSVNWKRKDRDLKMMNSLWILARWFNAQYSVFYLRALQGDEYDRLISSIIRIFKLAKENYDEFSKKCILLFERMKYSMTINESSLLKGRVFDACLEELVQSTLADEIVEYCLSIFSTVSTRLNLKIGKASDGEEGNKVKRELSSRLEEEGYEDVVISFIGTLMKQKYSLFLSTCPSLYFIII